MGSEVMVPEGQLTLQQVKDAMPSRQKKNITQELIDTLNQVAGDENFRDFFRENMLGYTNVLQDPNLTLPGYIAAVKYVSYKLMGCTNEEAWKRSHPERYQRCVDEQKDPAYIRSVVCAYNKGKMVQQMLQQSMIPIWVLNQDKVQQAINVQAQLMMSAKSEKVRSDAANSLLTHLKQPEARKVQLDVAVKQDDSITELRKVMTDLAAEQKRAIQAGVTDAAELGRSKLIDGESERID
jgi:hypothetical protein